MTTSTHTHSHCVVQWEDDKNEYAVVHVKRAKTSITLKVGIITSFEGNNRDRRRGKILYIGTKNDCTVFSFEFEDQGGHVNTYSWSVAPGLSEQIGETAKAIKNIGNGNLHRTTSSSSTNSTKMQKNKKRKVNNREQHTTDNPRVIDVNMVPASPPAPFPGSTFSTITIGDTDQPLGSNDQSSSKLSDTNKTSTTNNETTVSLDIDRLREEIKVLHEENKALRAKNTELEEQLLLQRETSIPLPDENCYNYLKSMCSTYEQCRSEQNVKMIELAKNLPCTDVEIKLAKKLNPAATINNLIKCCFKNVDLAEMSFEKLKAINPKLVLDIYEFVKCVHAPTPIPKGMFSNRVSLKCRHLRHDNKNKNGSVVKATKRKRNQSNNIPDERTKQNYGTIHGTELEESEEDKENDEHF